MSRHSPKTFFSRLAAFDQFFEPLHREIVQWLNPPRGGHIADIGCGAGGVVQLLSQAVGETGTVTAVETNDEKLAELRTHLDTSPIPNLTLKRGELPTLLLPSAHYDLTWSSRVVHHLADPVLGVRELARITKPAGKVAIREGGVPYHFLPYELPIGKAGLEDRLRVAQNHSFDHMQSHMENRIPQPHGWLTVLRSAGLQNVTVKSFLYEPTPPFTAAQTTYLRNWLNDIATNDELPLDPADRATIQQLTDPNSPHYFFTRDDIHFLYVASIYIGDVK